MKCYDVRCPICNTLNRRLVLEETQGWMECEHCQQVVKVLAIPGFKSKTVPVFSIQQLNARLRATQ